MNDRVASVSVWLRLGASAALVLALIPAAHAGDEAYLRWDNCLGDGGTYNKVFACDTNSGEDVLVGSFRLGQETSNVSGLAVIVHIGAVEYQPPSWWLCQTGGCRQGSVRVSFDPPATSTACLDAWSANGGIGAASYQYDALGTPYEARLKILMTLPAGPGLTIAGGQEMFAFRMRIDHARTTGVSACGGCSAPACIVWGETIIGRPVQFGGDYRFLGSATPNNGSNVTWQPGAVATTIGVDFPDQGAWYAYVSCLSETPARNPTWGSIKSLYR